MPEAAMYQNNSLVPREYQIRPAGQSATVQAKPQAGCMQPPPQQQLRPGVTAADAAHVQTALFGREDVCHGYHTVVASATTAFSTVAISPVLMPGRNVTAPNRNPARYSG